MSDVQKIFKYFTRKELGSANMSFDELFYDAIEKSLLITGGNKDKFFDANINRHWNYLIKHQEDDFVQNGILPVVDVNNDKTRNICCFLAKNFALTKNRKYYYLKSRPSILNQIDLMSSREFEGLSVYVTRLLGAQNTLLTPSGNEGGIDFIATIGFNSASHFLFGTNGPVRIIGQCKKYSSDVQVDKVKEFSATLNDVFHRSSKVSAILPSWFINAKGPIIGWIIAHNGFQDGARQRARNFGTLLSDSRVLGDVIAASKKYYPSLPCERRFEPLLDDVREVIKEFD